MTYKDEKQNLNKKKIELLLNEYNFPDSFADYFRFSGVKSNQALLNYLSTINNFLIWCIDNGAMDCFNEINKVTPKWIVKYFNCLLDNGYKHSTIKTKQNQLSSFFNYLVEERIVDDNPIKKNISKLFTLKKKKNNKKMPKIDDLQLLETNLSKISNYISRKKYICIYNVLKGTGLRESELCGVNISDIHLNEKFPYVNVIRKGSYHIEETESVLISGSAAKAIVEWLEIRKDLSTKCDALFLTRDGERIKEDNIIKFLKKYSKGTITPHMLRHLYTSELYRTTKDLAFVQEQCGHSLGSSVTMDVYTHGSDDSKQVLLKM